MLTRQGLSLSPSKKTLLLKFTQGLCAHGGTLFSLFTQTEGRLCVLKMFVYCRDFHPRQQCASFIDDLIIFGPLLVDSDLFFLLEAKGCSARPRCSCWPDRSFVFQPGTLGLFLRTRYHKSYILPLFSSSITVCFDCFSIVLWGRLGVGLQPV